MHFSTVLPVFLLSTLISAQPPVQFPLHDDENIDVNLHDESVQVESCTIRLPTSYQQISQSSPQKSFPQNNIFKVSQANGGTDNINTLLRFSGIPPGSYGCQLAVSFTFEYPIESSGSTLLNVYALPNPISPTDTYTTYFPNGGRGIPKGASLFGSITITRQKVVINSQVCKPSLGYLFQIASDTKAGNVTFADAGNNLSGIGGFYLTYNC